MRWLKTVTLIDAFRWKKLKTSPLTSDLSILDLVSMILLRLDTLKPYALPLCPLFMKFPNAKTTSRTCVRRLLLITSRDAHRIAKDLRKDNKDITWCLYSTDIYYQAIWTTCRIHQRFFIYILANLIVLLIRE